MMELQTSWHSLRYKTWSTPWKGQQLENLKQLENLDIHSKHQNENISVSPASSDIQLMTTKCVAMSYQPRKLWHTNESTEIKYKQSPFVIAS